MKLCRNAGDAFGPFAIALFEGTPDEPKARIVATVNASPHEGETSARALADLFVRAPEMEKVLKLAREEIKWLLAEVKAKHPGNYRADDTLRKIEEALSND